MSIFEFIQKLKKNSKKDESGKYKINDSIIRDLNNLDISALDKFYKFLDHKDFKGDSPLMLGCKRNKKKISFYLASLGADIYLENNESETPIQYAEKHGFSEELKKNYFPVREIIKYD